MSKATGPGRSDLKQRAVPGVVANEDRYVIQLDNGMKSLSVCLRPGQKMPVKERITKLIKILGEKRIYRSGLKVIIIQMKSTEAYNKVAEAAGAHLTWVDPNNARDKIVFIVSEVRRGSSVKPLIGSRAPTDIKGLANAQRLRKQVLGQRLPVPKLDEKKKPVEVIELDSDEETSEEEDESESEDDEDDDEILPVPPPPPKTAAIPPKKQAARGAVEKPHTTVMRGLPFKTIIPTGKAIVPLYRLPDLTKFQEANKGKKVTYGVHPYLGDDFIIVNTESVVTDENKRPNPKPQPAKSASVTKPKPAEVKVDAPLTRSLRLRRQNQPQTTKPGAVQSGVTTRKRAFREISPESSSESDSHSSSTSDSDFEPEPQPAPLSRLRSPRVNSVNTSNTKEDTSKSKSFSETVRKPLRKGAGGRIYFNRKARLSPDQYYKNRDLFENWDKFVRNESAVSTCYKTMFIKTNLTTLLIYHLERQDNNFIIDRSVELVVDGGIRIMLEGEEVTGPFMEQINIETTTDLNLLLTNLMNAKSCKGCVGYASVLVYPGASFREDVWYSGKCSKIKFGWRDFRDNSSWNLPTSICEPCNELAKYLQIEKLEMEKLKEKSDRDKKFKPGNQNWRSAKSKPVEKKIRRALSEIFFDFWKQMGLTVPEEKKENVEIEVERIPEPEVNVLPEIEPIPHPPPPTLPSHPHPLDVDVKMGVVTVVSDDLSTNVLRPLDPGVSMIPTTVEMDPDCEVPLLTTPSYLSLSDFHPGDISDLNNIHILNIPDLSNDMIASLMHPNMGIGEDINIPLSRTPSGNLFPTFSLTDL